ncbi:hypothetical protein PM082_014326 [Marasmius tenuissimus]|nr:hypothetical protein PM082_014326 [Marasmius tenuissimus]
MALWLSNSPPATLESESELRAQYIATSDALEIIKSQNRELSTSSKSLEEALARITEKKQIYHSILHPIRRLPPEILVEIFRICTFGDAFTGQFPGSLDTRKAPWKLTQVCRAWRSVSASASSLWTQVSIYKSRGPTVSASRMASLEALLSIQLERSRGQALSLSYEPGRVPATSNEPPYERLSRCFARERHSGRPHS